MNPRRLRREAPAPLAEMNVVPLVDVMLVLLVIFIVTTPLLHHAVPIDLPQAQSQPLRPSAPRLELAVRDTGELFLDGQALGWADLPARLAQAAQSQPTPELHLRADRTVVYEKIQQIMAVASNAGIRRIGFVSHPTAAPP